MDTSEVRLVQPEEHDAVGELTAHVYVRGGFTSEESKYCATLRDGRARAARTDVLVAVDDGAIIGTVTIAAPGSGWTEVAGPDEIELRMLAVLPERTGSGLGEKLVRAVIARAIESGVRRIVLCSQPEMTTAHRLYARLGFVRSPERDWSPEPGLLLRTFVLELADFANR